MGIKKQQLKPDMEQWAPLTLGKENDKAVYHHTGGQISTTEFLARDTNIQSIAKISWERPLYIRL